MDNPALPTLSLDVGGPASLALAGVSGAIIPIGFAMGNEMIAGLAIGATVIALMFASICALISRRVRQTLRRLVNGDHFVHWRYSDQEWAQHLDVERRSTLKITWIMLLVIAAVLVMFAIGMYVEFRYRVAHSLPSLTKNDLLHYAIPLSIPFGILLSVGVICDAVVAWYRIAMKRSGRCAYIGAEGLYFSGNIAYSHLRSGWAVSWVEGDLVHLRFEHFGYRNHQLFLIPVPIGREGEARIALEKVRQSWVLSRDR
jgi:hypothetical protein